MSCKVVFIGGGSFHWTPVLANDLFERRGLDGSHLVINDIDDEAASVIQAYCQKLADSHGTGWKVTKASLDDALDGADCVSVSISTGGFDVMEKDYRIPEEFGIFHSVGDTVGPAGISRSLRNIPVFVDIAKKMEKLCPDAWMLHLTNPLTQITRAVSMASKIKCVGLCHGFAGTLKKMAHFLGTEYDDLDALCVGVNHFIWLKDITCKGRSVQQQLSMDKYLKYMQEEHGTVLTHTTDDLLAKASGEPEKFTDYLPFKLHELFGFYPGNGTTHVAENFPYFLHSKKSIEENKIWRKGVLPWREKGKDDHRRKIIEILDGKRPLDDVIWEGPSYEYLAYMIESLHTNVASRAIVAMPNKGQIRNLPEDVVVETWGMVSGSGIYPVASGDIPAPVLGFMQSIVSEQECTVEAALTGDRKKVLQAMFASPLVHNKDCIEELTDKLLDAQKEYLPQFT